MSRRHGRRSAPSLGLHRPGPARAVQRRPALRGADKRRFFNQLSDRIVVMFGVAAAVVGYGAGGLLGAAIGLVLGLAVAARAMVRGRFRRG